MAWLEVRCCCDPGKLLGIVYVRDDLALHPGREIKFALAAARGNPPAVLALTLERIMSPNPQLNNRLALKSDDTSMETLRRIATFHQVKIQE